MNFDAVLFDCDGVLVDSEPITNGVLREVLNESGWAFDVELLYRAQLFGYGIAEVPVNWHEVAGSKVNPLKDALRMFLAIFRIRRRNAGLLRHPLAGPAATAGAQ